MIWRILQHPWIRRKTKTTTFCYDCFFNKNRVTKSIYLLFLKKRGTKRMNFCLDDCMLLFSKIRNFLLSQKELFYLFSFQFKSSFSRVWWVLYQNHLFDKFWLIFWCKDSKVNQKNSKSSNFWIFWYYCKLKKSFDCSTRMQIENQNHLFFFFTFI